MGDPTGVVFLAATELANQISKQQQRQKDNYDPEKFRGTLYGKMRIETPEGEKWVPMMTSSIKQDTGFFTGKHIRKRIAATFDCVFSGENRRLGS